ncbi:MAG: major capsid protein [Pseudomonadota bacterium]
MDVSAAVTAITDGTAAVVAVGVAALTVMGAAAAFRYIRRAF